MNEKIRAKILLAIPTYNCANQITRVLDEIDGQLLERVEEIVVFDNGSSDETVKRALAYKREGKLGSKLRISQNVSNVSLGGTHKVAFLYAEKKSYSHVLILHGDNQAKSNEANMLIDYMERYNVFQTVLGSRFNRKSKLIGYDKKRILGNRLLNIFYSLVSFRKLEDLGSGLNLLALKDLDKNTYLNFADKLTFNYELILDLVKRKVQFAYVPITWREDDQVTNARNVNIFKTALIILFKWRLGHKQGSNALSEKYISKEVKR